MWATPQIGLWAIISRVHGNQYKIKGFILSLQHFLHKDQQWKFVHVHCVPEKVASNEI